MHSSRMRTARLLTVSRGSASKGVCTTRQGLHLGGLHLGGSAQPCGGLHLEGLGRPRPPVNRMTHRCKNITLPQTSFAGGKNKDKLQTGCSRTDPHVIVFYLQR